MNCKTCGQFVSYEILANKRMIKSKRIKSSLQLAKISGKQVGAVQKFDREEIRKQLLSGKTIKQVAETVGCSTWPVQQVKKGLS